MIAYRRATSAMARHVAQVQMNLQEFAVITRRSRRVLPASHPLKETTVGFSVDRMRPAEQDEQSVKLGGQDTEQIPLSALDTKLDLEVSAAIPNHQTSSDTPITCHLDPK